MATETPEFYALAAVVIIFIYLRLRAHPALFNANGRLWSPLRRYVIYPLDEHIGHIRFISPAGRVGKGQYVETVDADASEVLDAFHQIGLEVQPLAKVTKNWNGDFEIASVARYYGQKPAYIPSSFYRVVPNWLRKYQIHIRIFPGENGTIVTGHCELNPWRPLQALYHLQGVEGGGCEDTIRELLEEAGLI